MTNEETIPQSVQELDQKLEVELMKQEHRLFWILLNAWNHAYNVEDPLRRQASRHALTFRIAVALAPTAAVAGVGVTAVAGVLLAWQANSLLVEQNAMLQAQNETIVTQNSLLEAQNALVAKQAELAKTEIQLAEANRRASSIFELTSIMDGIAAVEAKNGTAIAGKQASNEGIIEIQSEALTTPLTGKVTTSDRQIAVPRVLEGRIVALSRSLRPYQYLGVDGRPISTPLSPERAQLLISLTGSGIDLTTMIHLPCFDHADLAGAVLRLADLPGVHLSEADLEGADLRGANLERAHLRKANLTRANLDGVNNNTLHVLDSFVAESQGSRITQLLAADLTGSTLCGAYFGAVNVRGADMREANLEGAYVWRENWLEASGAILDKGKWHLVKEDEKPPNLKRPPYTDAEISDIVAGIMDILYRVTAK